VNDENLRGLIKAIMGELSEVEVTFMLNGLFKLDQGTIEFVPFAKAFFSLVAELGLSRYQKNHDSSKKTLNAEEFVVLLRNTFKFLDVGRVKKDLLLKIFGKIDTNHDGLISIGEYMDWVNKFLAVDMNHGEEYYLAEDDEAKEGGDIFEADSALSVLPDTNRASKCTKFNFSNYDLSDEVRKKVWDLLVKYDKNKDSRFDENEIHEALIDLLKENQHELAYVTRNVFRYDKDGDRNVTYEELTNFCVEQHFGEMAIQRLHKKKGTYSRGKDRVMNEAEFEITLNNALDYIGLKATPEQVKRLFSEIDLEKTGWISYEVYFLFLLYYFGSLRGTPYPESAAPEVDPDKEWLDSLSGLSALDRLIRLLLDQLVQIFSRYDLNKNMML
jgi:Ca2+-binding EF-hand superfamily protein